MKVFDHVYRGITIRIAGKDDKWGAAIQFPDRVVSSGGHVSEEAVKTSAHKHIDSVLDDKPHENTTD